MANWARKWALNTGPKNIYAPGAEIEFKHMPDRPVPHYVVDGNAELPPAWRGAQFIERGQEELEWNEPVLNSWNDTRELLYDKRIAMSLYGASSNTLRLEGELTINNKKEKIMILIARDAALDAQGRPVNLLIIKSIMKSIFDIKPHQDGTAHGNPK